MEKREEIELPALDSAGRRSEKPLGEGWVSGIITGNIISLAHSRRASFEVLLRGVSVDEQQLTDHTAQISWADFLQLWRNASTIWDDDELVELGRQMIQLDSSRSFVDAALLVGNPINFFRHLSTALQHQLLLGVDVNFERRSRDRFRIAMRMPEGIEPCPPYYLLNKGLFESLPTIFGYPMASVDMSSTDRGVAWEICIHPAVGARATLRHLLKRLRRIFASRARLTKARDYLVGSFDIMRDRIHELDAKLTELQNSEERFIKIFQSAPTAMLISRISGMNVVDVNDELLALTGYSREVVMGWGRQELRVWASLDDRDAIYTTVQDGGGSLEGREIRLRHKDGREIVALLSAKPVDLAGEPCIVWQAIDITARKQIEVELAAHRDQLEELVEERSREIERSLESMQRVERLASIGTLAAGIAHQINNPVASIRAAAEFALMCDDQPDAVQTYREALETCVEQSDRCGLIVRNILRFSRGESGERSHLDLRQLLVRSCQLVASYAVENNATIELDEGETELPVFVNAIEMEQVFVNVLRNAIESGDGKTRVEVLARRLDTGAFVEIRDDGPGIDPAHLPFLFDPFYTTRLEHDGTGLGLSVAHGIVNSHGGAIHADAAVDHGTAIQIQIPLESGSSASNTPF